MNVKERMRKIHIIKTVEKNREAARRAGIEAVILKKEKKENYNEK